MLTADCLPVLLCDRAGTVVAAAHAGWRGLAGGVSGDTVAAMRSPPENLLAWLGPAIGRRFEVGSEVRDAFVARRPWRRAPLSRRAQTDKWLCDIYLLARQRLQRLGSGG